MMGRQPGRFEEALRKGYYLFHLHTDWTDGESSVIDYCTAAKKLGFQTIIFTEHIRRKCSYDFQAFLRLAKEQQSIHGVEIMVGVEAKILSNGLVDIPEWILPDIEVLAIAEHAFQGDAFTLAESLIRAFKSFRNAEFARVWVHPGLGLFLKKAAPEPLFQKALQAALENGVYIELNLRHKLPPESLSPLIPLASAVIGLDAHSIEEVEELAEEVLHKEGNVASAAWNERGAHEDC